MKQQKILFLAKYDHYPNNIIYILHDHMSLDSMTQLDIMQFWSRNIVCGYDSFIHNAVLIEKCSMRLWHIYTWCCFDPSTHDAVLNESHMMRLWTDAVWTRHHRKQCFKNLFCCFVIAILHRHKIYNLACCTP